MLFLASLLVTFMSSSLLASTPIPWIQASAETQAIPKGKTHTDDAAIWWNESLPSESRILGTSKYGKEGQGGLGVYDLSGRELQFFPGNKLNSVDLVDDFILASNRSEMSLDLFEMNQGTVSYLGRQALKDSSGNALEPYGLCSGPSDDTNITVFLPLKNGHLLAYHIQRQSPYAIQLIADYNLGSQVSSELDSRIREIVYKSAVAENELDELEEALTERYILEGCVYDAKRKQVYVGMENAGIWVVPLSSSELLPELLLPLSGSWTDLDSWATEGVARISDDIEGLDIVSHNGKDLLLFSVQGLSEFALYDLDAKIWVQNFKLRFEDDLVSKTDGIAASSKNFGPAFPSGLLIVHDDMNTEGTQVLEANYKIISLADLWKEVKASAPLKQPLSSLEIHVQDQ